MDKIKHKIYPATDAGINEALSWCQNEGHTFMDFTPIEVGEKVSMVYREKSLTTPHPEDVRSQQQYQQEHYQPPRQNYPQENESMLDGIIDKAKEYWIFSLVGAAVILFYFYRGG